MSHFTMQNRTIRTSSRCAVAAGFLVVAAHAGGAYAAVNPEPGGPGCQNARACQTVSDTRVSEIVGTAHATAVHAQLGGSDPVVSSDLARPADLAPNTPPDYRLVRLVDQAQAGAVQSQLAGLRR